MYRYASVLAIAACLLAAAPTSVRAQDDDTFDEDAILEASVGFFGSTTEGLAKVIETIFAEQGRPNAYVAGEEVSGAIGVGLRYGKGTLTHKTAGSQPVFWQGPSIGWDLGGNASKTFILVYRMRDTDQIFQRFPGIEGSIYFVAGVGANYHQSGDVILAPIRTGVGLRAGANVGYLHFTREHSWLPF